MERLETVAAIETPEQIALSVEIAGVGSRFAAYVLDLLWQLIILVPAGIVLALVIGGAKLGSMHGVAPHLTTLAVALLDLLLFVVNFGYFALFEILWRGQTPGKRSIGLRVMRAGGFALTPSAELLRNLLRVVDSLPFGYVLGVVAALLGNRGQRIGDLAAGTWVVREPKGNAQSIAEEADSDALLARDFLHRHSELTLQRRERVGVTLANAMAARRVQPAPTDYLAYLREISADHSQQAD